jgi:hypothetical protein
MKAVFLTSIVLSCAVSFSAAADPKKDAGKKAKVQKVSARDLTEKYDTDSDRKLDKTELHAALRSLKFNRYSTKTDSWKQFDTDKDDKLESKELDALLDANAAEQAKVEAQAEADAAKAAKTKTKEEPKIKLIPPGS